VKGAPFLLFRYVPSEKWSAAHSSNCRNSSYSFLSCQTLGAAHL